MKKNSVLIYFLLFFLMSCSNKKYDTLKKIENGYEYEYVFGDPMKTRIYTLKNGLKVYLSKYEDAPRLHILTTVKAGGKNDPKDNTGLAHYLEHMMFKGNKYFGTLDYDKEKPILDSIELFFNNYSKIKDLDKRKKFYKKIDSISNIASSYAIAGEYDKLISQIGGKKLNAGTHNDYTVYTVDIPSNEIGRFLEIEGLRFQQIVNRLFHTELEAVYEEKNRALDNDSRKSYEELMSKLFPNHPYGTQSVLGTVNHLKNPSITEIKNYFDTYYSPNNMSIAISGDIDYNSTIKLIDENFGNLKSNKNLPVWEKVNEDKIENIIRSEVYGPSEENLEIGFRFNGIGSNDHIMILLVDMILNNRKAGLIDLNLMQNQLVLNAGSTIVPYEDYCIHYLYGKPKKGQDLSEVESLIVDQIDLIKDGEFDDWLIEAIINDYKINLMKSYESNYSRARAMSRSFIYYNNNWAERIRLFDKMMNITKEEIIDFVKKNYRNNYVAVYKKVGADKNLVKIEKPSITKVNLNRNKKSDFFKKINDTKVEKIKPRFLDFKQDLQFDKSDNIPIIYKRNEENDFFEFTYLFDFGKNSLPLLPLISDFIPFIGSNNFSSKELQKEFYKIGCNYSVSSSSDQTYITISGLDKYMENAIELFEDIMKSPVSIKQDLDKLIDRILKKRINQKKDKRIILQTALFNYAKYGKDNPFTNILSESELKNLNIDDINKVITNLYNYPHQILYYGKRNMNSLKSIINQYHKVNKNFISMPKAIIFEELPTTKNKVFWTDFDMVQTEFMLLNRLDLLDNKLTSKIQLYNNYFGSGMGSIVFQEIREAQGLAYSVGASYRQATKKNRYDQMLAYVGTQSDKQKEAMKSINQLINNLPKSEELFDIAKKSMINTLESERITKSSIIWKYINLQKKGLNIDERIKIYNEISNLNLSDLEIFQREHIKDKSFNTILIGKKDKIDFRDLKKYGEIEEVPLEDLFGY